jgi:hypothetical protein
MEDATLQRLRRKAQLTVGGRLAAESFPALVRRAGNILSILSILSEGFSFFCYQL